MNTDPWAVTVAALAHTPLPPQPRHTRAAVAHSLERNHR
jgi:hypothetical protein